MNAPVCLLLILSLGADGPKAANHGQDFACQVILGPQVKSVQLRDQYGVSPAMRIEGPVLHLKPGRYRVEEVWLEGNYFYRAADNENVEHFDLSAEKPYHIEAGTLLTPHVRVTRRGSLLKLDYELQDAGGRNFRPNDPRSAPPRFSIRQQGSEIASGDFQYG